MEIKFYDNADDSLVKIVVIVSKMDGKWVFCKHKERDTFEVPGGHREPGETVLDAAERELQEETGAIKYTIQPVCIYSVTASDNFDGDETFGGLFCAEIEEAESELHSEIESIHLFEELPSKLTYPLIQPVLIEEAVRRGKLAKDQCPEKI